MSHAPELPRRASQEPLFQRIHTSLSCNPVLHTSATRHANPANDLIVENDWQPALDRNGPFEAKEANPYPARRNCLLQSLGWTFVKNRRSRLLGRNEYATQDRSILPRLIKDIARGVGDRDHHWYVHFLGFS